MRSQSIIELCRAWNQAEVKYLIFGGLAVVAHGYLRATHDIDVVVDFSLASVDRVLHVLERLGNASRLPIPLHSFADPILRAQLSQ
jgi:predicted nucleotidyltransferase